MKKSKSSPCHPEARSLRCFEGSPWVFSVLINFLVCIRRSLKAAQRARFGMTSWKITGLVLCAVLNTSTAVAGNRPGAVTLTLANAYYHFAQKRHVNNNALPNFAFAYNFDERWAVEAGFGVINTTNSNDMGARGVLYTVDGLYRFKPHWYFEPYLIGGVGVLGLRPPVGSNNQYQANVNFGAGTQFFADKSIALRGEIRDLHSTTGGNNDWMVNLGLSFLFGGASQPIADTLMKE